MACRRILLIWPLRTNFGEILIEIYTFSFKKMHLKMSAAKWRPFCLSLNVLRSRPWPFRTETESRDKEESTGCKPTDLYSTLPWRHNGRDGVSNHQPHHCLLNGLFRRRSKKTSKLRVTGLCAGNSPVTGEFPAQMASNAENVSIWWRHHEPVFEWWKVTRAICLTRYPHDYALNGFNFSNIIAVSLCGYAQFTHVAIFSDLFNWYSNKCMYDCP